MAEPYDLTPIPKKKLKKMQKDMKGNKGHSPYEPGKSPFKKASLDIFHSSTSFNGDVNDNA